MKGNIRLAARLDVKDEQLVKGVQFEGLRKLGDPHDFALRYYGQGADELLYIDTVASLYGRNHLSGVLRRATQDVFIPITAGGGLRSVEDVQNVLQLGADKAAVNTAALKDPFLLSRLAEAFGSQCVVLSIQAKRRQDGGWEAYYDNGREHSGRDAVQWARQGAALGAGEILLTSVDCEGLRRGMDAALIRAVCGAVPVPVIAAGGAACAADVLAAADAGADAVAAGSMLHYGQAGIPGLKQSLRDAGWEVRL